MSKLKPLEEYLKFESFLENTNIKTKEEKEYFVYLKNLRQKTMDEYQKFKDD